MKRRNIKCKIKEKEKVISNKYTNTILRGMNTGNCQLSVIRQIETY